MISQASLVAEVVKNPPVMRETWIRSLGQEDPLEKEMATHSGILAWEISWTEESGKLESIESQRVRHDWATNTQIQAYCARGEGEGSGITGSKTLESVPQGRQCQNWVEL